MESRSSSKQLLSLKISEEKYRTLFESATDAIYLVDPSTQKIIDCNQMAAQMCGYTNREMKSMKVIELYPDSEQVVVTQIFKKIIAEGQYYGITGINQQTKFGALIPVEMNARTITIAGRHLCLCFIREITIHVQTEDKLRESQNKYRYLVDSMKNGMIELNSKGLIVFANPKFREMLGYNMDEILNRPISSMLEETSRQHYLRGTLDLKRNSDKPMELRFKHKNASIIDILFSSCSIFDNEDYKGEFAILVDITERKKIEAQIKECSIKDDLTGLYNRRGFFTLAEQQYKLAARSKNELLLIYLDLDNLKQINDRFGHAEGDYALKSAAKILKKTFRDSDIIARIGGDEFAVLLTKVNPSLEPVVIRHLADNLLTYNQSKEKGYNLSLSSGIATYSPDLPVSINELLSEADSMMYKNKKMRPVPPNPDKVFMDQRGFQRKIINQQCSVMSNNIESILQDIGEGGMRIRSKEEMFINGIDEFAIIHNSKQLLSHVCTIVWSIPAKYSTTEGNSNEYEIGLKFLGLNHSDTTHLKSAIKHLTN
ncbi:diguanylate cyclase [bacterium]|nr:diguanylate cyclase [bacterium]